MWTSIVASPPSSRIMLGPSPSGQVRICSVHHQYSASDSPFQAKTGTPCGLSADPSLPTTIAAAAWSWVEKMLQLAQRTSAPSAVRVSIKTAVWTVMCSEPAIRAPASGLESPKRSRIAIRPGISCSARVISVRPKSANDRSATLKSMPNSVEAPGLAGKSDARGFRHVAAGRAASRVRDSADRCQWLVPGLGDAAGVSVLRMSGSMKMNVACGTAARMRSSA